MENKLVLKAVKKFANPIRSILSSNRDSDNNEYLAWSSTYDSKGQQLEEIKYFNNGEIEEIHTFSYADTGFLKLHHIAIPNDNIEESFLTERDESGLALEVLKMYGDDPGEKTTYKYNSSKLPIEIVNYDADGELENTETINYDVDGKMLERTIVSSGSETPFRNVKFSYNENGQLTRAEEFDKNAKSIGYHLYEYDADGREIRLQQFNGDGKRTTEVISEYDQDGLLIRKLSKGFYTRISTYDYDTNGRLIQESYSDENDFVISRNNFEYNDDGSIATETVYETDLTRAGRDTHLTYRYLYEFHD